METKNTIVILGYGILDKSECRNMYISNKRKSKKNFSKSPSSNNVSNRGT